MNAKGNRTLQLSAGTTVRRSLAAAAALGLVVGLATTAAAVNYSTSPGKNAAFEAATGNVLTVYLPKLTATIEKGKKRTVLAIEAGYTDGPYAPIYGVRSLGLGVTVNGVAIQPNPASAQQNVIDCGLTDTAPAACTIVGTFWLDIDAAEAANPGVFVGQPLSIVMSAGHVGGGPPPANPMDATLTVRVQKK
jgi:hypothetical protein